MGTKKLKSLSALWDQTFILWDKTKSKRLSFSSSWHQNQNDPCSWQHLYAKYIKYIKFEGRPAPGKYKQMKNT